MGRPVSGVCWYLRKMKPFSLSQPHFFSQVGTLQFQFRDYYRSEKNVHRRVQGTRRGWDCTPAVLTVFLNFSHLKITCGFK